MKPFLCAHATHPQWGMAAALVLTQLRAQQAAQQQTSGAPTPHGGGGADLPSLALLYITDHYLDHAQDLLDHLMAALPEVTDWVGTVGLGIAVSGVEYFDEPALALMLLDVPPNQYRVFSGVAPLPAAVASVGGHGGDGDFVASTALVHADAATPDVADLIVELAQRTATGYVFGGLSSSRSRPVQFAHSSRGAIQGQGAASGVFAGGLSGVAFGPGVSLVSRVTQGCTPVGPTRTVTAADRNLVLSLDGEPALDALLAELAISLDEPQAAMARLRSTLVGLSPGPQAAGRGGATLHPSPSAWRHTTAGASDLARRAGQLGADVRVRHIIGLDPSRHGVAVADLPVLGEQLVFCTRNADAARADLMRMCAEIREDLESDDPFPGGVPAPRRRVCGAIYVSCTGRGGAHFGGPHAELQCVRRALGDVPLVGFFAGGEIADQQLYGYSGVLTVFVANATDAPDLAAE